MQYFYFIVFILLLIFSIKEVTRNRRGKEFFFFFSLLFFMVVFRFGQGTDYLGYVEMYSWINVNENIYDVMKRERDPGFALLSYLCKSMDMNIITFMSLFAVITMLLSYKFFKQYCVYPVFSLFIFYVLYFLIYPYSAIRQGLALSGLLFLFPYLIKKKWVIYCAGIIILSSVHFSCIIALVFPLLAMFNITKKHIFFLLPVLCLCLMLGSHMSSALADYSRTTFYISDETDISLFAVLTRFICIVPLLAVPEKIFKKNNIFRLMKNIYFFGFILYFLLSFNPLIASRVNVYCKVFEVALFPYILMTLMNNKTLRFKLACYIISFLFIMYLKNIDSFFGQVSYSQQNINVISYPYISIFNQDDLFYYTWKKEIDYKLD